MPQLSDLDVPRVDLVDRSAIRDPQSPEQPMRFLVFKAEKAAPKKPASSDELYHAIRTHAQAVRRPGESVEAAIRRLGWDSSPQVADLVTKYFAAIRAEGSR